MSRLEPSVIRRYNEGPSPTIFVFPFASISSSINVYLLRQLIRCIFAFFAAFETFGVAKENADDAFVAFRRFDDKRSNSMKMQMRKIVKPPKMRTALNQDRKSSNFSRLFRLENQTEKMFTKEMKIAVDSKRSRRLDS